MKALTTIEMQEIEMKILLYIKEICEKHNLRYYLAYGTLIGAIRHKGFIPWDDDVDIMMPRQDYLKLVSIIDNTQNCTTYRIVCVDNNRNFTAPLAKVIDTRTKLIQHYGFIEKVELGVYVDIFIIDGTPGDYNSALQYYDEAYEIYKKWNKADSMMFPPRVNKLIGLAKWLKRLPLKIKGYRYWLDKLEEHNKQYSFDECEYVSVLEAGTKGATRNVWPRKCFGENGRVLFEGEEFAAPVDYDYLLKSEYGDYMTLPPKEKQVSHHYSEVYWKE